MLEAALAEEDLPTSDLYAGAQLPAPPSMSADYGEPLSARELQQQALTQQQRLRTDPGEVTKE